MDVFKIKLKEEQVLQTKLGESVVAINDYNSMTNKPSIDGVTLVGDVLLQQLGLHHIYYATTAEWNAQPTLMSEEGTIYIYSDYETVTDDQGHVTVIPAMKIGDGSSYLIDMPITGGGSSELLLDHIRNQLIHVSADDRTFWDNKSSAYLRPSDEETLVLSNNSFQLGGVIYSHG